jgi:hypothetical protein
MTNNEFKTKLNTARAKNMAAITLTVKQASALLSRLENLEAFKDNIRLQKKQWGGIDKRSTSKGVA